MGKSTISMAIFNSKLLVYQRVNYKPSSDHGYPHDLGTSQMMMLQPFAPAAPPSIKEFYLQWPVIKIEWEHDQGFMVHGITIWRCEIFNNSMRTMPSPSPIMIPTIRKFLESLEAYASRYPLVNIHIANWKNTFLGGVNPLFLWPFSIAFSMFIRGYIHYIS